MSKKVPIIILVLLVLIGIIFFSSQADNTLNPKSTIFSQTNNNLTSPAPTSEDFGAEIERDLNELERLLDEEDSNLDDSDLTF